MACTRSYTRTLTQLILFAASAASLFSPALIRQIGALCDNGSTVSIELSGASFPIH